MNDARDLEISAYVDGAMDAQQRSEFERRLAADLELRERLDSIRELDASLSELTAFRGDDGALAARIARDLALPSGRRSPWPVILTAALSAAAGFLVHAIWNPTAPPILEPRTESTRSSWRADPDAAASITRTSGEARILSPDSKTELTAPKDSVVRFDSELSTGDEVRVQFETREGSTVWLDERGLATFSKDGSIQLHRGRVVVASGEGSVAVIALGGERVELVDGACAIELGSIPSKSGQSLPSVSVCVVRGTVGVADRTFSAGASIRIDVGTIVENTPKPDTAWFLALITEPPE